MTHRGIGLLTGMAGTVNRNLAEWLIVALILFSLAVEFILHKWDSWLNRKHKYLTKVMTNLYKELMILGMISFGFILYIFVAEPSKDVKMTFEVAHIFIFLFAIFHTIVLITAIIFSLGFSRHWKRVEHIDIEIYKKRQRLYRTLHERRERYHNIFWEHCFWWIPNVSLPLKYWKVHETIAFHDTRFQFIKYKGKSSNNFHQRNLILF